MSADPTKDFMSNVEEEVALRIRTREQFFSNVSVLTCAAGDTNKKIAQALEQLGLFILVELKPRGKIPYVGDCAMWPIWITITETPATNRGGGKMATNKTARAALEELLRLIDAGLGIDEAEVEPVDDPNREIFRVIGKIGVTIQERK